MCYRTLRSVFVAVWKNLKDGVCPIVVCKIFFVREKYESSELCYKIMDWLSPQCYGGYLDIETSLVKPLALPQSSDCNTIPCKSNGILLAFAFAGLSARRRQRRRYRRRGAMRRRRRRRPPLLDIASASPPLRLRVAPHRSSVAAMVVVVGSFSSELTRTICACRSFTSTARAAPRAQVLCGGGTRAARTAEKPPRPKICDVPLRRRVIRRRALVSSPPRAARRQRVAFLRAAALSTVSCRAIGGRR